MKTNETVPEAHCPGAGTSTQLLRVPDAVQEGLTNMAITNVELLKLGSRIRAFRKVLGRSQKDFAEQCGLDRSILVEWNAANVT